jgi:hypothetical protein
MGTPPFRSTSVPGLVNMQGHSSSAQDGHHPPQKAACGGDDKHPCCRNEKAYSWNETTTHEHPSCSWGDELEIFVTTLSTHQSDCYWDADMDREDIWRRLGPTMRQPHQQKPCAMYLVQAPMGSFGEQFSGVFQLQLLKFFCSTDSKY